MLMAEYDRAWMANMGGVKTSPAFNGYPRFHESDRPSVSDPELLGKSGIL